MPQRVDIDDDVYAYLWSQTRVLGETASDILRRLLRLPPSTQPHGASSAPHVRSAIVASQVENPETRNAIAPSPSVPLTSSHALPPFPLLSSSAPPHSVNHVAAPSPTSTVTRLASSSPQFTVPFNHALIYPTGAIADTVVRSAEDLPASNTYAIARVNTSGPVSQVQVHSQIPVEPVRASRFPVNGTRNNNRQSREMHTSIDDNSQSGAEDNGVPSPTWEGHVADNDDTQETTDDDIGRGPTLIGTRPISSVTNGPVPSTSELQNDTHLHPGDVGVVAQRDSSGRGSNADGSNNATIRPVQDHFGRRIGVGSGVMVRHHYSAATCLKYVPSAAHLCVFELGLTISEDIVRPFAIKYAEEVQLEKLKVNLVKARKLYRVLECWKSGNPRRRAPPLTSGDRSNLGKKRRNRKTIKTKCPFRIRFRIINEDEFLRQGETPILQTTLVHYVHNHPLDPT